MIIATCDTRHYSFTAVGRTEQEAVTALKKGWVAHCAQSGKCKPGEASLYRDPIEDVPLSRFLTVREFLGDRNENVNFLTAMAGHCYAEDGEQLT